MLFLTQDGKVTRDPPMISFLDHGFLFGDSLYEVVRVYQRKVFGWVEHRERLIESARRMSLDLSTILPTLENRMRLLLSELREPDAALRMIITRGVGPLHINTRGCKSPTVTMAAWKFEKSQHLNPISLAVTKLRRNSREALDPAIKSGNYLNSVMALREAQDRNADDALMLNVNGHATELTTSNFGFIKNARVCTPHENSGLLLGITRRILLETHTVERGEYSEKDLRAADEIFALSTFKEVVPVKSIQWENGETKTFSHFAETEKLQRSFREIVEGRLAKEVEWY